MRRLYSAIPSACRVEEHKHDGCCAIGGSQAVESAKAKIRSWRLERQAMHEIKEHRGLPEHVEHTVLTNTNSHFDRPEQREAEEQDAKFQRIVRE